MIRGLLPLAVPGGLLLALTLAALALHVPGAGSVGTPERYQAVVALLCVSAGVYLLTVWLLARRPPVRGSVWLVLAVAVAMRVPLLVSPPFLSSDIYRYVWDGRVQGAGINPYRYVPDDPALAELRDRAVFPHINRGSYAPTIYPPAAQLLFALVDRVWSSVPGMKLAMAGWEIVAAACLWRLLAKAGLPRERLLIYAWNPLPVWAFAGNGHIDAMVVGLVSVALWLRVKHSRWTGIALGLAFATKFLPAVIAPALWRRRGGWWMAGLAMLTVAAVYAVYASVGMRVFGFLFGYGQEEGLANGAGVWALSLLDRIAPLPGWAPLAYMLAAAAVLAVLGCWVAFVRRPDDPVSIAACAGALMAVLTFAISPHYPWYFAWLAVPSVLAPNPAIVWLSCVPVLIYLGGYGDNPVWSCIVYVPALLLPLLSLRLPGLARWPAAHSIDGGS